MKISVFLSYATATNLLLTFLPSHQSEALSFMGIKNVTSGNVFFDVWMVPISLLIENTIVEIA
jgi:hypothetical protein